VVEEEEEHLLTLELGEGEEVVPSKFMGVVGVEEEQFLEVVEEEVGVLLIKEVEVEEEADQILGQVANLEQVRIKLYLFRKAEP
jgi:hypothetical protein